MAIFALVSQYVLETWTMRLATTKVSMEPQMMDLVQSKVWENGPKVSRKLLASITTNKNAHAFVPCQPCTRLDVVGATTENWPHWSNSEEK